MEVNLEEKKATINAGPASLPKEACHFIIYFIITSPTTDSEAFSLINIVIICCGFIFMP